MKKVFFVAFWIGWFAFSQTLQAGVYNPAEPWDKMFNLRRGEATNPRPIEFSVFLPNHYFFRTMGMDKVPADNAPRLRAFLVTSSVPRAFPTNWPLDQKISLSAYLIRRGKSKEAIELLKPLSVRERNNFLVLANLGTAYQLEGQELGSAIDYLDQAQSVWPRTWKGLDKDMQTFLGQIGWDEETFLWYREAESYHAKLVRLRAREARGKVTGQAETLDALYDLRFENGKLVSKVPANALAIVQQLLIWLPDDPRLYWLLGELYHARGEPEDLAAAKQIFTDLAGFNGRFRAPLIVEHLRALASEPQPLPNLNVTDPTPPPTTPPKEDAVLFDLRALLVGFGSGLVVSFLAYWQLREFRRRRLGGNEK